MTASRRPASPVARRFAAAVLAALPAAAVVSTVVLPAAPARAADAARKTAGPVSFVLPAGWAVDEAPKPMRLMTLVAGEGAAKAEASISALPANFGSPAANVNRWRAQVGLPPVADAEAEKAIGTVKIAGLDGKLVDVAGKGEAAKRLVVAFVEKDGKAYFFRLTGAADAVEKQRAAFDALLASAKID